MRNRDSLNCRRTLCAPCFFLLILSLAAASFSRTSTGAEPPAAKEKNPANLFNGMNLDGWRVADMFDFAKHGPVVVEKGEIVLGTGQPATGISWKGELPRMNYELSLDAKRIEGDDFFCGLTFPVDKSYCTLIIGGWGGGVTGLSNLEDQSAVDNATTGYTEFKQNQWYRIRLRVTTEKVEAWIDKEQIVDVKAADRKFSIWWEQEPVRPLGIATWRTKAALRNIQLTRLEK